MKILDAELGEFDFNDADNLEKFEEHFTKAQEQIKNINPDGKSAAVVIRETCNIIFKCFDGIFGKGTSKKIFGGKTSLKVCTQAFKDLKAERDRQDQEMVDIVSEINSEYSPNRAARRAKR